VSPDERTLHLPPQSRWTGAHDADLIRPLFRQQQWLYCLKISFVVNTTLVIIVALDWSGQDGRVAPLSP
jgi:hypothetical protein